MPSNKRTRSNGSSARAPKRTRGTRRITKFVRKRRPGSARPMRSLSTGFRGTPNQYRFVRETIPVVIDLGTAANGVSLIAGTGAIPNIAMFKAEPLDFTKLAKYTEFQQLFNNFIVDKIETVLIPMWETTVNPDYATSGTTTLSDLMITRVNTKWLINGLAAESTAESQRGQLAEIQKKTRSLYSGKKWMKLTTSHPDVPATVSDGAGNTNTYVRPSPWLSLVNSPDQRYSLNDVFFADRLDGKDFVAGVYLYRMYHKVHFRTSFVG